MKVRCDVCENAQASVMCCADEAALCADCDSKIHAANKLAGKHQRVPLLHPTCPEDSPRCDICQDQTGFFFCVEDRALLCRACDFSIHSTNALSSKHRRFLITGTRVALQPLPSNDQQHTESNHASCSPSPPCMSGQVTASPPANQTLSKSSSKATKEQVNVISDNSTLQDRSTPHSSNSQLQSSSIGASPLQPSSNGIMAPPPSFQAKLSSASTIAAPSSPTINLPMGQQVPLRSGGPLSDWGSFSSTGDVHSEQTHTSGISSSKKGGGGGFVGRSSISEYLTETIPGWKVDELLNFSDMAIPYNFMDSGTSKTDTSNFGDMDWMDYCALDGLHEEAAAEVPSLPSPPTASGLLRSGRSWGFHKSWKKRPDPSHLFDWDDALLVVPDVGGDSSPPSHSPSPRKRSRNYILYD